MAPADIANYPFTTIDANRGVAYVRVPCPCTTLAHSGGSVGLDRKRAVVKC